MCLSGFVSQDAKVEDSVTRNSTENNLASHNQGSKMIMDFLAVIVLDSLALPVNNKGFCVIDIILEVCGLLSNFKMFLLFFFSQAVPDNCSSNHQVNFQTDLLSSLMDRLVATDLLSGETLVGTIVPGGSPQHIPANIVHLASRVVDKLWQGKVVIHFEARNQLMLVLTF